MPGVEYIRPGNLAEALAFLSNHGPDAKILAGGTDVMIDMRSGGLRPRFLVDVSRLEELRRIDAAGTSGLTVGAAVTIAELLQSSRIGRLAPALQTAAATFASQQVRNVATIGGNIAHCSPCGDTVPPLLVHDARAVVAGAGGRRILPVEEMASGPYHCALRPDEVITHFVLAPKPAGVTYSGFLKIGRRRELAIARISMAAMAAQHADGRIESMRFALGACTPTPHRFDDIEAAMIGKRPDDRLLWQTGRLLADQMLAVTGRRPSADYKEPAIQGLFVRLMQPLVR